MPEYLNPGVYVEEVSFRSKAIEGVETNTTGFVGPTRYGPVDLEPNLITSLNEFERVYGDGQQLTFSDVKNKMHNFMWHAARAFFEEGGKRLYVARTFNAIQPDRNSPAFDDGRSDAFITPNGVSQAKPASGNWIRISARFPGSAGKMRARLTLRVGQSVLGKDENDNPTVAGLFKGDIVLISSAPTATSPQPIAEEFYSAKIERDPQLKEPLWKFTSIVGSP